MGTVHTDQKISSIPSPDKAVPQSDVVRREIPAPGRSMSFEEALSYTLKTYPNALRELAK